MFIHQPHVPAVDAAQVPDDAYLLDVREAYEWEAGHIEGARHIPLSELLHRVAEVPRGRQVHVVCKVGARSAQVAQFLNANGWDAVNVDGGMVAWVGAGRPMVRDSGGTPSIG
jgi:rhodanese-related sulfurtransferase